MTVAVAMPMAVLVAMLVVVLVVMGMSVPSSMRVFMTVAGLRIGALLGREWRVLRDDAGAEPTEHGDDHMVLADPQPPVQDLHRQVAIAEMPGEARERSRAVGLDVAHLLVRGRDLDHAAVVEDKPVSGHQDPRLGKIEQEGDPVVGRERDPAPVAVIEIERRDADPALARPGPARDGFDGAAHGQNRK